jgi:hypothetical protein
MVNMTRAIACVGLLLACLLGYGPAARADADQDRMKQLEQRLEKSLAKIDALEARVHELEAKQGATAAAVAKTAPPAAAPATAQVAAAQAAADQKIESLQTEVDALNRANASRTSDETSLPIHGFADVGVGNHNQNFPDEKGFNIAELDFYLTPQLGTHTKSLFELNFETNESGSVNVDLERAQLGYEFNDYATLWVGRFHTPYGYYNTAYHHGRWLMIDLRRPRFIEFEDHGGAMPAHTVGAWLTGRAPLGDGKLTYDAYFGNGQRILNSQAGQGQVDMNSIGNNHGNAIYGGRMGYEFGAKLEGFAVGVDAFSTKIGDDQVNPNLTKVTSAGVYVLYDTDTWEFLSEYHAFHDTDLSGMSGTHNSHGAFADLAYRLGVWAPYLRWEQASFDQGDQYFLQQQFGNSYRREALGLRYDIDPRSGVKLELAHTWDLDRVRDQYNDILAQYAIRF